jgi:hypothetical protein
MDVMFATRDFLIQVVLPDIKEHTLETNLMSAMFATNDFRDQVT